MRHWLCTIGITFVSTALFLTLAGVLLYYTVIRPITAKLPTQPMNQVHTEYKTTPSTKESKETYDPKALDQYISDIDRYLRSRGY